MLESQHWKEIFPKLIEELDANRAVVLVTLVANQGSTPRDVGSKMLVGMECFWGSVGGGNLEFQLIRTARQMIEGDQSPTQLLEFNLSASLGQCCGGKVTAFLELYGRTMQEIVIFGAGHVGAALVPMLTGMSWKVKWIDSREELLSFNKQVDLQTFFEEQPHRFVKEIKEGSLVVILTHSHDLDFQILTECLKRDDLRFVGLIGSRAKWKRFSNKLAERGVSESKINSVVCPIGRLKIHSKHPKQIALSIASQLLEQLHNVDSEQREKAQLEQVT